MDEHFQFEAPPEEYGTQGCECDTDWLPWIVAGLAVLWGVARR